MSLKYTIISDMKIKWSDAVSSRILARMRGHSPGAAFTPKDFLDLATHETVRQALSRMSEDGRIRRIIRGVYDRPAFSSFLNAPASPSPDEVAKAIARAHGWTIQPTGETALNLLGISPQVPSAWAYLSDGPSRIYKWSGGTLAFKHRANKETGALSHKTALLVQALKSLGEKNIDGSVLAKIKTSFSPEDISKALRESRYATSWVHEIIKQLNAEDGKTCAR